MPTLAESFEQSPLPLPSLSASSSHGRHQKTTGKKLKRSSSSSSQRRDHTELRKSNQNGLPTPAELLRLPSSSSRKASNPPAPLAVMLRLFSLNSRGRTQKKPSSSQATEFERPTIGELLRSLRSSSSSTSSSSQVRDYMTCRQTTGHRLLVEMLGETIGGEGSKSTRRVLIMDEFTVKIMSSACTMSGIVDKGIALVEDLYKKRQPLPFMDVVYFIQPTASNVDMFLSDMSGRHPLYNKAFVFFSSPMVDELAANINVEISALPRITSMTELNLEYLAIDAHAFVTGHEKAMGEVLFANLEEGSHLYNARITTMAARIATVFASLGECPSIRFRAPKPSVSEASALAPSKLAAAVWDRMEEYKAKLPGFPEKETCDLLIVDRSVDQIAPIIHEWTYEAMCRDLLRVDGNKYTRSEAPGKQGSKSGNVFFLDDHDPLWVQLRHVHAFDVSEPLFQARVRCSISSSEEKLEVFQALLKSLGQNEKLPLHVEIVGKIYKAIKAQKLQQIGRLEQDLVFGHSKRRALIEFLRRNYDISTENKLRLMMIYATIYPEEIGTERMLKLMQLANLSPLDRMAVKNMSYWTGNDADQRKPAGISSFLKFGVKENRAIRKERSSEDQDEWRLSKFYPLVQDLIQKLSKGELPKDEYPYLNAPRPVSRRTRYPSMPLSSRASSSSTGAVSALNHAPGEFKMKGKRIFVFIIGGATRSELRVVHELTSKLKREVILGSTSLDDPLQFVSKLRML